LVNGAVANAVIGSKVGFTAAGTTDSQVAVGGPRGYEEDFANNKLFFQWFTNGVAVPGAVMLNLPTSSVWVAVAVPFTLTVTPGIPLPFLSVTVPVTVD